MELCLPYFTVAVHCLFNNYLFNSFQRFIADDNFFKLYTLFNFLEVHLCGEKPEILTHCLKIFKLFSKNYVDYDS